MNPSIDAYMAVMSPAKGSFSAIWIVDSCLSSRVIKDMCGECRSSVSQYSYRSRSFSRSIAALPIVVYSASAGVVPKGNRRHRKTILSNI